MRHDLWQWILAACGVVGTLLSDLVKVAAGVTTVCEALLFVYAAVAATFHILHYLGYPVPDLLPFVQFPN